LPVWVDKLNTELAREKGVETLWEVEGPPTGYSAENPMAHIDDSMKKTFGATFPHHVQLGSSAIFTSPHGITMTVQAAEHAIDSLKLGRGKGTDLLALSFSAPDYLGHAFGPNSLEMEELTVAEDRALAGLFGHVKRHVPGGLKRVLIVLTGDHGVAPNPDLLSAKGAGGRLDEKTITDTIEKHLGERFGTMRDQKWIAEAFNLNFFLNPVLIANKGVKQSVVENEVRSILLRSDSF